MNGNFGNQDNDKDGNLIEMTKLTYWEKYGVKRFPYPGRRKYTPCLNQASDGGMIISNDVFGLTIRQFERMYTAFHLFGPVNDPNEKYLYDHLVKTVGTEIDIRNRQRLFIIQDMIYNATITHRAQQRRISSGSLAEGLDLPGSDLDIMSLMNDVNVIQNVRNIKHPIQSTTLVMETDIDHPGFTRLRLIAAGEVELKYFESTRKGLYLSLNGFWSYIHQSSPHINLCSHGPCLSDKNQFADLAVCLWSKFLPNNAIPWSFRHRRQWPPNFVIDRVVNYGCLLVPIGPRTMSESKTLWRISFSVAEKLLVHSFNFTQLLCYVLLKLTLKRIVNTTNGANELLCSYFLKTALFWVSEEEDINTFRLSKLYYSFTLCLDKLILWVSNCYCPNYFIPEHNMFLGKINQGNNNLLLSVLDSIKSGGIDRLIKNLCPPDNVNFSVLSTKCETSFIMLDFLFYKICDSIIFNSDILICYKVLAFIESLLKSESSSFIKDVCKYNYAKISKYAAQCLPPPTTKTDVYNIHKRYHRHLQDGFKADAVSGWLLYASFYYVTGQYNVTLRLTEYVLSRCSPDMTYLGVQNYDEEDKKKYRQNVHSTKTFIQRMKIGSVESVKYLQHSSLIPGELQLEVEGELIHISPIIISHCLRFLCNHHLGNIFNRQQSLRELYLAVNDARVFHGNLLSDTFVITGVCYEISGDKKAAYQCYVEALRSDEFVCSSAEARKSNLLRSNINL
ncbi:unnamed protein product [Mytilus coruscus]|uniref:Mab-21-like HhH/H2TH-like domain-containing protein n=1 Tax=Mytilus coruscus TaxID=42192 RepID=A0A6J8ANJ2_MYTCO|nr:unnamed protein product [Mytilus coruscus]